MKPNFSESFGMSRIDRIHSDETEFFGINLNETEFFGIIRVDSDRPDSFGLKVRIDRFVRIHLDETEFFGITRIDSDRPSQSKSI